MKLGIIGSRNFNDFELLDKTVRSHWYDNKWNNLREGYDDWIESIVSGGAKGADSLGAEWAKQNQIKLVEYLPDWDKYGKRAGFVRNEDIIKNSDFVLAFWDGLSKGTANSLSIAKKLKKPTLIIYF